MITLTDQSQLLIENSLMATYVEAVKDKHMQDPLQCKVQVQVVLCVVIQGFKNR